MLSKNIRGRWTTSSKLEAMLQKSISNTTKSTDEVISTPIPWCNLCHRSPQLRSQINCSWTFQPEVLATFLGMHWRSASMQKGAKKGAKRQSCAKQNIFSQTNEAWDLYSLENYFLDVYWAFCFENMILFTLFMVYIFFMLD